ncbi:hypothetical protein M9H77_25145 [Catharanthus roseus]|uniref:Uncharacterized protein n=1 Tax=Catharanthus roseus TaxID=4058 RepID=A0ACC0A628_CATRO|nr:hypothetical protein M9H77_25145 [Catharanthus roseus]
MDHSEEFVEENIEFENDVDPNTFEEFLELEEYVDHGHIFTTDQIFNSKVELVNWAKETAMEVNTYLIVTQYLSSRISDRRAYVTLGCERGGVNKSRTKPRIDDEEEEVQVKMQGPYETKKCDCPFKLKGEQMATCENWQLFVHDGRHNYAISVYTHGHAQAAKLTDEQLIQMEQFRKSHVPPRNILRFFWEQNVGCAVNAQKIYNVVAKIKNNRIHGRNTVEEVLCLSAQRCYTVFYRNCEDNDVLSDIVVAHPTSIEIMKTWPYVLIIDTTFKTNKYNMPLLEAVGMMPDCYLALKKIWNEILRATEIIDDPENKCRHYIRTRPPLFLRADYTAFWKTLEIDSCHPLARQHDMDYEMRSFTGLLHQISTEPISNVREMCHLAKGVLNPVLPKDPGMTLTSPPEIAVTKGRKKTNSTKRDKSYWEHVSIAHRKIQKSSGSGSDSGSGSRSGPGSGSSSGPRGRGKLQRAPRGKGRERSRGRSSLSSVVDLSPCCTFPYTNTFPHFIYLFIENWKNVIGDENCRYHVVADYVFGDDYQWPEIRGRMLYELEHLTNMYLSLLRSIERVYELVHRTQWHNGPMPLEHWLETPDSLYVIANAINLCVILITQLGSTTVLSLYLYSDCPGGTLLQMHDGCPIPSLHMQWIHHHSKRVSSWADIYYDKITYWNARVARNRN